MISYPVDHPKETFSEIAPYSYTYFLTLLSIWISGVSGPGPVNPLGPIWSANSYADWSKFSSLSSTSFLNALFYKKSIASSTAVTPSSV